MSDSVKPNDAQQPDATAAPVAVVVIPATGRALTDELRRYLPYELERDTIIAKLRMLDRVLGRPQTVQERRR
jgi:hypothetical protein